MSISLEQRRQALQVEIAASVLVPQVKQQLAGIVNEPVAVHADILLTFEVYSFF
jgi:hypothetical protein